MNRKKFILAGVALGLAGVAYTAAYPLSGKFDKKESPREATAAGTSMHEDEHMSPLHRQIMNVFVLPEMQSELGFSTQQAAELHRLRTELVAKAKVVGDQTATRRRELDALLTGDTSRTRAVKALFEKIADLRAQLQYAGFETAGKMKAVLNDSQKAKFNAMKPADLHRLMMSRANQGEMEAAMQIMTADESVGMQKGMNLQGGLGQAGIGQSAGMMSGSHAGMAHDAMPSDAPHGSRDSH
jgi:Spy/CpxP family protein refolding chaperone